MKIVSGKIDDLLNEFYKDKTFDKEIQIVNAKIGADTRRLESAIAKYHDVNNIDTKNLEILYQKILSSQKEMQKFTEFLKNKYFN